MFDDLVCPISNIRIDRNVVRVNGLITTLLLVAYVVTRSPWIAVPVGLDYALRARMSGPTSPMAHFATFVARTLGVPYRAMDKAPKVFASRIGVCFALGAAITHFVAPAVAPWLAGTLAVFTALESVFDLCVGCVVYTYIALPLYRARDAVKAIPLFAELEEPMLLGVVNQFVHERHPADTRLATAGEEGDRMYFVRAGEVEVFREDAGGGRTVLGTQGRGTFFGELALLRRTPRTASVRAVGAVELLALHARDFDAVMQRHPGMRAILERTAAERVARDEPASAG